MTATEPRTSGSVTVSSERPYDPRWYFDFITALEGELAGGLPVARQRTAVRALYQRFLRNRGDNDKRVFSDPDLTDFLARVDHVARMLDAHTLRRRISRVPEHFRRYLLAARGESAGPATVELKSIMALDGQLLIYGFVDSPYFEAGDLLTLQLEVSPGTRTGIELPDAGLRHSFRYFGRDLVAYRAFDLRLPVADLPPGTGLAWELSIQPGQAPLRFSSAAARLAPELGVRYAEFDGFALHHGPDGLRVVAKSAWSAFTGELSALAGLRNAKLKPYDKFRELGLRLLYYLTRPAFNRRLVLYYDKLYMGGDNGQHLFEHASARAAADGSTAEHRYIVHRSSPTYAELRAKGLKVIDFASPLRKLWPLNAHLVAATHANVFAYCGLNPFERRWFAALLRAQVVCIQHGLTVQYIPQLQARQIDNTARYYCASPVEIDNLRLPAYCYPDSSLKLTGLARYDGLVPDTRPVVLVCPTWRRYVANDATRMGRTRAYTDTFVASPFYEVYAGVLTDPALLEGLKERGYRLRFVLHPTLSEQAADFRALVASDPQAAASVDVEPAAAKGYEHHLRQGAILVTDYSGIQFDFATMRKPLVYFHPDALPPSYPPGDYDPARDGFGPVARDGDSLRETVLGLIDDAGREPGAWPRVSGQYAGRVDAFFPFNDRNNSERIYAELKRDYDLG